jgi:hypothetical protein
VLFQYRKYLSALVLFFLVSCASVEYQIPSTGNSNTPPLQAYPLSTSYPEPVHASNPTPSNDSTQQSRLAPSPFLTPRPSPTVSITIPIIVSPRVAQLKMFDENTGWAVYSAWAPFVLPLSDAVLRTMDGVETWMDVTPPISATNSNIRVAYFTDANMAVAISDRSIPPEAPAVEVVPWRSTSAGQTWQTGENIRFDQASEFTPLQLDFIDSEHGWMLGESDSGMNNMRVHLFETQDGGMHWSIVYDTLDHITDPYTLWIKGYYPYLERFTFTSNTVGYFSDGRLFDSQDRGISWQSRTLIPPADLPELGCQGSNCNYLSSVSSPRFTSAQNGVLIQRAYLNNQIALDVFMYYPNTLNRLPLPAAQYLYFTNDGGNSWIPKPSPIRIGTIYFMDADTGWLLGKSDLNPAAPTLLYQTTDAGDTWTQISTHSVLPLGSELQFVDEQTGFAYYPFRMMDYYCDFDSRVVGAAQNPYLYVTNDGGRSWERVEPQVAP